MTGHNGRWRLLVALLAIGVSVSGSGGLGTLPRSVSAAAPRGQGASGRGSPACWAVRRAASRAGVRGATGARRGSPMPDLSAETATSGTAWTQQAELTATTQTAYDGYGEAVALSGNTAAIGAKGTAPSVNDPPYGAVYVVTRTTSGAWSQQAELLDPQYGQGQNHFFGDANAVALQGNTLVVGAWGATGVTTDTGAAFVYVRSGGI